MIEHILDGTDIKILSLLSEDGRTGYRSIGRSVSLTTNAVKNRVKKMVSQGVIRGFVTVVDPAVVGFSRVCYVAVKGTQNHEATLTRLKLLGQVGDMMESVGGLTMFEIFIREDRSEEELQSLRIALKPAEVLTVISAHSPPVRHKLTPIDLSIMKSMLLNPRLRILELAREIHISPKTAGERLGRMKDARILRFTVDLDATRMKGCVRFLMVIHLDGKETPRTVGDIRQGIRKSFLACSPFLYENGMIRCVPFAQNIYEIDPYLKKVEALDNVLGAEVYLPSRLVTNQSWMLNEIDKRIDASNGRARPLTATTQAVN